MVDPYALKMVARGMERKGDADPSGTDDVAGIAGMMSHATPDSRRVYDSGFHLRVYIRSLSPEWV